MDEELDQLKKDLTEMFYYGCTSTQVYTDYVQFIDHKIKALMIQIADIYEEHAHMDKDQVDETLGKQYQEVWCDLAPHLKQFKKDIQDVFEVSEECVARANVTPDFCFQPKTVQKLESEIEELQQKFKREKFYLEELKRRQEIIETISHQINEAKLNQLKTVERAATRDMDLLKEFEQKTQDEVDKFLEKFDISCRNRAIISKNLDEEHTKKHIDKIMEENTNNN